MSAYKLMQLMEKQGLEPEVIRMMNAMLKPIAFTDTLYVSAAGDNSDGSSWNRAYTSLLTALDWIETNQANGEVHCILLQAGIWDINTTGTPTYNANLAIYGVDSRQQAIIVNNHATATHVLEFTGWVSLNNLTIDCGVGNVGINIDGVGCIGSRLRKIAFDCAALTGAADAILIDGAASYIKITDILIIGEATNTTGIRLNEANHCIIQEIKILTALVGIHLDNAGDDDNIIENIHVHTCTTGLLIDAGAANNHFEHIFFLNNTTRIDDNGTTTLFSNIYLANATTIIAPDDVAGVLVVGGVGANVWTVGVVQIRAASATPFRIVGIRFELAVAEKTGIRLYSDGGTNPIFQDLVETGVGVARNVEASQPEPLWVNQGLAITARVKSEAGNNNCLIWLQIQVV